MAFERIAKSLKGARDDIIKIKSVDEVIPIINKQKIYLYWLQETHAFWNIRVFKGKRIKVDKVLPVYHLSVYDGKAYEKLGQCLFRKPTRETGGYI